MKTWVFNQEMLDRALASYCKKLRAEGVQLDEEHTEAFKQEVQLFLVSDAAIEAKMLMRESSGEAKR